MRCTGIALVLLLAGAGPALAQEKEPSALERLRRAILESRERVGEHEEHERALFDRLEEIDQSLAQARSQVRESRLAADATREELADVEARRGEIQLRLRATRAAMSRRVVALYKSGEVGAVRVLFSSSSLRDLLTRSSMLRTLVEYDAALLARFRRDEAGLAEAQRDTLATGERLEAALALLRERNARLAAEAGAKRALLRKVRGNRTEERAVLVELEKSARALEETLGALGERALAGAAPGVGLVGGRGSLPRPVLASIAQPFGRVVDREFLTETFRKGVEFAAGLGESVRSIAPGAVRFAGWFRGYGKIVIIDHGGEDFTVSGHLGEVFVAVGDRVREGDMVGSVGETGSLTGPGLYFELRHAGEPVDPQQWLSSNPRRAAREPAPGAR